MGGMHHKGSIYHLARGSHPAETLPLYPIQPAKPDWTQIERSAMITPHLLGISTPSEFSSFVHDVR